ncbi:MAG: Gfo/Idh/MocA family oxidoreductase [Sedimentisphaerales bacterium]|nr:Gfo/Idh/MocA family oxidoreductase [Sedimentisphaerales bacterium]
MLRLAMIGTGGYAFELIKRIWMIPDKIKLVAATSNPVRKRPGADICRDKDVEVYDSVDEMFDKIQGRCDVVYVPTPIQTHSSLTKQSLSAGFDVFLEKPPTATIQELDELIKFVDGYNTKAAVCFQYLYTSIVRQMKENICSGRYGKVKKVRSISAWERLDAYFSRSDWGGKLRVNNQWVLDGTINNPLAHVLSNDLYLASMEPGQMARPKTVQAELYHVHDIESEDTSSLRVITTDGVEVVYHATLCAEKIIEPITIVECENAVIEYKEFNKADIKFKNGRKESIEDNSELRVSMLEQLASSYENKKPYCCTLETCRPFTITVNGAFESSGLTHGIDAGYIKRFEKDNSIKTVVDGLQGLMEKAFEQGRLFSELGAPWAVKTVPFDVKNYSKFPSEAINL